MRLIGSTHDWQNLQHLEEQVIADQFAEQLETGTLAEGVDLVLKFSLTAEQVHRICGDIVGQGDRMIACSKFVQNWLMHSSVDALNKYLEGK